MARHDPEMLNLFLGQVGGGPSELTEFAATDAALALILNWTDAKRTDPDFPAQSMVEDIDGVIELLNQWKNQISAKAPAAHT
jgi:hypothetical protein